MKVNKKKSSHIKTVYYRNFFLLIVLPLLLVLFFTLSVMRESTLESANEKIALAQQNVITALTTDIKASTLKLSHFLNSSNGRALELAAAVANSNGQDSYDYRSQLEELYNFAVTPSSDIIAIHFYSKDGEVNYLKDGLAIPLSELRRQRFYTEALDDPDQTHVGSMPSNITYMDKLTDKARMALVVAFAPQKTERSGSIEMVCMYTYTHVNVTIQEYSSDVTKGRMCLVDNDGKMLIPPKRGLSDYVLPWKLYMAEPGNYTYKTDGKMMQYTVSLVPGTNWRLVNAVDESVLLQEFNRTGSVIIAISLVLFALFIGFSLIFLRNIIVPVNRLIGGMHRVEGGDLDIRLDPSGEKEMRMLTQSFNSMIGKTKTLMLTNEEQQREKHRVEMQALQSQINPHFLVNSLSNIRFMAIVAKYNGIKNMTEALIKILSTSFRHSPKLFTIKEEIELLESYVYLMQIRYAENFDVTYEVDEECNNFKVPRLILQPIMENSIVHGFEDKDDIGTITVTVRRADNTVMITICDNGKGMTPQMIEALLAADPSDGETSGNIGVSNVNKRIKLNFGTQYGLSMTSQPGKGTTTTIVIPAIESEESQDVQPINR